ncbi:MAG: FAD-dependent oxidoreductase [Trueperaceae bacterium]
MFDATKFEATKFDATHPLRVLVVGAGPSGFYTAEALLKDLQDVSVDLLDRLPTPYGLVRYGVAPDHQKIKSVTKMYEKTSQDPRFRFLGNVNFGSDITHAEAKQHYHAIVYTVGASADRNLGIPGENFSGSMSATEFVAWYNGHPDYCDRIGNLDAHHVAVVGMGNVAVDVTRILAKSVDELRTTDIADHALDVLKNSKVTDIYMLGRRGPAQAKFTTKELRELGELENADIVVNPTELELSEASVASIADDPGMKKNIEILQEFSRKPLEGKPRRVHIRFLVSPVELLGDNNVKELKLERNRLDDSLNALGTGEFETLPMEMVLRSVGYKGVALHDVPFDTKRGVIPHHEGRVLDAPGGNPVIGEYVAGWIKRGPSGVVGTNKACASDTVKVLVAEKDTLPSISASHAKPEAVDTLLEDKGVRFINFKHWQALDAHEQKLGAEQGRPRVKVTKIEQMLELAK